MKASRSKREYEITWLIRRLFRAMSQEADRYLKRSGITAADRAVMEFLHPDVKLTVPDIANRYDVSRQHVQVTVNGLQKKNLLRTVPNPKHKRSSLVRLSARGRSVFSEIRQDEATLVQRLFAEISDDALDTTGQTLRMLLQQIKAAGEEVPVEFRGA